MDSKIVLHLTAKRSYRRFIAGLTVITVIALCAISCKQNNWMDWKVQNELWLENNKTKDSVQVSSTGLQYKILADPTPKDAQPNTNSIVTCDYTARLINGCVIDVGNKVVLDLSGTIPGFSEGCHKIHNNGDIELYIPAYLGYDATKYQTNDYNEAAGNEATEGTQSYIPPYSTLIYTVHISGVTGE